MSRRPALDLSALDLSALPSGRAPADRPPADRGSETEEVPPVRLAPPLRDLLGERMATVRGRPVQVLVLGCAAGDGPSALVAAARALGGAPRGARLVGMDPDPVALQELPFPVARGVEVRLRVGGPDALADLGDLDLVLWPGAPGLAPEARRLLEEGLRRHLAPGGHMVLGGGRSGAPVQGLAVQLVAALPVLRRTDLGADADLARVRVERVLALAERGEVLPARGALQAWARQAPWEALYPVVDAELALREGMPEDAARSAREAVRIAPSACMPAALLAEALAEQGDPGAPAAEARARALLDARLPESPLPYGLGLTAATLRLRLGRSLVADERLRAAG